MAPITFIPVFQVAVFHEYFESGHVKNMSFRPFIETIKLMERLGMLLRIIPSGFEVFIKSDSIPDFMNSISAGNELDYLEFTVINNDPYFINYTQLPLAENFSYLYTSENQLNELKQESIHLKSIQEAKQNDFASIRIYLKDLLDFQSQTLHYSIYFEARATRWDYYIINQSGLNIEGLKIETHEDFDFLGPQQESLPNGYKALKFTSGNRLLNLSEMSKYNFSLVKTLQNGSKEVIIKVLPVPNPDDFEIYEADDDITKVSSQIYIHI
ncbi:MAG: hypothetical protein R2781_10185 [Flavobacteriaceae bacterium]